MLDIDALSLSESTFRRRGKKMNRYESEAATCVDGADSSPIAHARHAPNDVMTNAASTSSEPPSPHRQQQTRIGTPPSPLRQQRLRFNSGTPPLTPPSRQRFSSGTPPLSPPPPRQQRFSNGTAPLAPPPREQRLSNGTLLTRTRSLPLPIVTPPASQVSPGGENLASSLRSLLRRPGGDSPGPRAQLQKHKKRISFDFSDEILSTVETNATIASTNMMPHLLSTGDDESLESEEGS